MWPTRNVREEKAMKAIPANTVCVRRPDNDGKRIDQTPPYYVDTTGCVTFMR